MKIDTQLKDLAKRLKYETEEIETLSSPYETFVPNEDISSFIEANYSGQEIFQMKLHRNEYVPKDDELSRSFEKLQKDCEDLKYLMKVFSKEIFVCPI